MERVFAFVQIWCELFDKVVNVHAVRSSYGSRETDCRIRPWVARHAARFDSIRFDSALTAL